MNKKLVKTRNARLNTLEAMGCGCNCGTCDCTCTNCSGGGSFQVTEMTNKKASGQQFVYSGTFTVGFAKG